MTARRAILGPASEKRILDILETGDVRSTLPPEDRTALFRKYCAFLNAGSYSRSIFEILAAGTPVISAPWHGHPTHETGGTGFQPVGHGQDARDTGNHGQDAHATHSMGREAHATNMGRDAHAAPLLISESREQTDRYMARLLNEPDYRDGLGVRGVREVMDKHTYHHRARTVLNRLNIATPTEAEPLISILCVSHRPEYLQHAVANFVRQTYPQLEIIFVANSADFDRDEIARSLDPFRSKILWLPQLETLGECLNEAERVATGDLVAKFDDDDWYGPEYLRDLALAAKYSGAAIIGKRSVHCHFAASDELWLRYPGQEYCFDAVVHGGTLLIERSVFKLVRFEPVRQGTDSRFEADCLGLGLRIFAADRFNFIHIRRDSGMTHTWKVRDEDLQKQAKLIGKGLQLERVFV